MARTLIVTTSYAFVDTGRDAAGGFVASFAEALRALEPVAVVAPVEKGAPMPADSDLELRPFEVPRVPLSLLSPTRPDHWQAIGATLRAGARAVAQTADAFDADRILALWALPSGHWARRAARHHGIPYYTWALGSDIWRLKRLPIVRRILSEVMRDARLNFADGLLLGEDVRALTGRPCEFLPSSRYLPIPNGPEPRTETQRGVRLAYLGRWHPNKGVDLLLDALSRLDDRSWARIDEVRIAGGGPLAEDVTRAVASLTGRRRPVTLSGFLDRAGAAALLSWADALVIPSRVESIPVVFSDAMAAGLPVVATPVGDLPALVDEHGVGRVCPELTSTALADTIAEVLGAPLGRYRVNTARARAVFSPEGAARRFRELAGA